MKKNDESLDPKSLGPKSLGLESLEAESLGDESLGDESLAMRAKAGDRRAFDALVGRHKARAYGFCRRYVGDAEDAYDLVQDAFAAAWLGLRRFDERRSFAAWLSAITLNKCRDFCRRRTVRRKVLAAFARDQAGPEPIARDPGAIGGQAARLERLDQAIAQLPSLYKDALLLTALGGLSHQAAATALGATPKAVEMRIHRAKRLLAAQLGEGEA